MGKLVFATLKTFLIGTIALGALLFVPAGTLDYWQAWVFIVVFMVVANVIGLYLSVKDPQLLERRKNVGPAAEKSRPQKIIASLAIVGNMAILVFCALDHRFGWSPVPAYVSMVGNVLVVLGLLIDLIVFKENSFGGSTVQIFEGQQVISTGPYALVRHPMYSGVAVMIAGVPLALGSWWGLVVAAVITLPALIWRILDEERLLKHELPGYAAYTQKVRHRLVPYLW